MSGLIYNCYNPAMTIKKRDLEKLMYIEALLLIKNELGRPDLIDRFDISTKSASMLIKTYGECCPGQMILDKKPSRPIYVASNKCKPCLLKSLKNAKDYLACSTKLNSFLKS